MTPPAPPHVAGIGAFVLSALGFFGIGYEVSGGGVSGLWEHWYCSMPLFVLVIALSLWLGDRRQHRAA